MKRLNKRLNIILLLVSINGKMYNCNENQSLNHSDGFIDESLVGETPSCLTRICYHISNCCRKEPKPVTEKEAKKYLTLVIATTCTVASIAYIIYSGINYSSNK
jgi:hypothetical protein